MRADFDVAARTYDEEFTFSKIGVMQRKRVWGHLEQLLDKSGKGMRILELNCGTGEDALRFAQKGHHVVATDISDVMLQIAKSKANDLDIVYQTLDLNAINGFSPEEPFDLIFSNFGGVNCLAPEAIRKLGKALPGLLNKKGRFIAVVMPQFCIWEVIYYVLKGKFALSIRRNKEHVYAHVSGIMVKTFYYSPGRFDHLLGPVLIKQMVKPIGLFIPPSYLERFFSGKTRILNVLFKMERLFAVFNWQAYLADHYFIVYSNR